MVFREKFLKILYWSQKYTQTDMVYLAKGGFWILLGKIMILAISFIKMVAFGRLVMPEIYGMYNYLLATISIFSIFSLPGIDTSLIKSVAQSKEGVLRSAVKTKLRWALVGSLGSFILSLWYFSHNNFLLGGSFLIGAIFLPLHNAFLTFSSFWHGRKMFDIKSKYEAASALFGTLFLICIILLTDNIILIVLAFFVSQIIPNGILLKKTLKNTTNNELDPDAISFGKNLTAMNSVTLIAKQIDKVLIWKLLGPVSVAVYSFALLPINKVVDAIPIASLALPKLGQRNVKEIKISIFKKFIKLLLLIIPVVIFVILIAPYVYKFFFPNYLNSIVYFQALALLLLFTPFSLLRASLISERKKKELYIINIIMPIFRIISFLTLVLFFGILGAVITLLITQFLNSILILYFFKKL